MTLEDIRKYEKLDNLKKKAYLIDKTLMYLSRETLEYIVSQAFEIEGDPTEMELFQDAKIITKDLLSIKEFGDQEAREDTENFINRMLLIVWLETSRKRKDLGTEQEKMIDDYAYKLINETAIQIFEEAAGS